MNDGHGTVLDDFIVLLDKYIKLQDAESKLMFREFKEAAEIALVHGWRSKNLKELRRLTMQKIELKKEMEMFCTG